jgi:nitrate reductase delta subunit
MRPETPRALGALLLYPTAELREALPRIGSILSAEEDLPPERRRELASLLEELANRDLLDLEEAYTALFDRGTSLSLHLFEHVYGEWRERGQAMVELIELYRREGFILAVRELPDHLPALCEFLSVARPTAAAEILAEVSGILALLRRRLAQRDSPYAAVLAALCDLTQGASVEPKAPETPEPVDSAEQELAEIDRAWEEAPVSFGAQDPMPLSRRTKWKDG